MQQFFAVRGRIGTIMKAWPKRSDAPDAGAPAPALKLRLTFPGMTDIEIHVDNGRTGQHVESLNKFLDGFLDDCEIELRITRLDGKN